MMTPALHQKQNSKHQRNPGDKDNSVGDLGVLTSHSGPINTERSVWDKTIIVDDVFQNIEDLINDVITSKIIQNEQMKRATSLVNVCKIIYQLENAAPSKAERLAKIIQNIWQGHMRKNLQPVMREITDQRI